MNKPFDLGPHGITVRDVFRNLSASSLYEEAIRHEPGTSISDTGCLLAYSGEKTGRSPKDKRVVDHPGSKNAIWRGKVNTPYEERTFKINRHCGGSSGSDKGLTATHAGHSVDVHNLPNHDAA